MRILVLLHGKIEVADACIVIWVAQFLVYFDNLLAHLDAFLQLALLQKQIRLGGKIHVTVGNYGQRLVHHRHR